MPNATIARTMQTRAAERAPQAWPLTVEAAARQLADAEAEYDAALDERAPLYALVRLDQEVLAATRRHHAAVSASDSA